MIPLTVRHRTTYRYHQMVSLGPHRLMLRPRESRDLRLTSSSVTVAPAGQVAWAHDVFGNSVATAMFQGTTDSLVIDSVMRTRAFRLRVAGLRHRGLGDCLSVSLFRRRMDGPRRPDRTAICGPGGTAGEMGAGVCGRRSDGYALPAQGPQPRRVRLVWLPKPGRRRRAVADRNARSRPGLLPRLRRSVRGCGAAPRFRRQDRLRLSLQSRSQSHRLVRCRVDPRLGGGVCLRRRLDPFDPTNRSVGGFNLIPVAVARDIRQAMPVAGNFVGNSGALREMAVEVEVRSNPAPSLGLAPVNGSRRQFWRVRARRET